jgi:hypothetical protein
VLRRVFVPVMDTVTGGWRHRTMRSSIICKKKCSATSMQVTRGTGSTAPTHCWLRWGWVVKATPRPRFTPGKGPPVPIVQETGWASKPVWTQRLEEKSFATARDRAPVDESVVRQYWQNYPSSYTCTQNVYLPATPLIPEGGEGSRQW